MKNIVVGGEGQREVCKCWCLHPWCFSISSDALIQVLHENGLGPLVKMWLPTTVLQDTFEEDFNSFHSYTEYILKYFLSPLLQSAVLRALREGQGWGWIFYQVLFWSQTVLSPEHCGQLNVCEQLLLTGSVWDLVKDRVSAVSPDVWGF